MDKFYNDNFNVFSSNKYIENYKTNDELSVFVPKLKSYRGMFRVLYTFVDLTYLIFSYTLVNKTNSNFCGICEQYV